MPRNTIFTSEEIHAIYKKLTATQKNQNITKEQHVQNINQMLDGIDKNICPRCQKNLVLRKGSYGQFFGCSGYPNCKFTKK